MNRTRPVTLQSLARELGLNVSTVSRVLNGSEDDARGAAAPDTVKRIRALAAELQYQTNPHAASLKTRRSRTIGVLVPRLSDMVLATIYEGIDEAAAEHGYLTFVSNTQDEPDKQRKLIDMALARRVDGLILGDAHSAPENATPNPLLAELARRDVPFVLVSRHADHHCAVTCDDREGGRLAAKHLLDMGHRRIAVMVGESFASTGRDRSEGFFAYCAQHGLDVPAHWRIESPFDTDAGRDIGARLLSPADRPTAIFAVNDFLAVGVMGAARDQGLEAGRDVAIVGYNDTPLAGALPIGLTTIHSPMHEMGRLGLALLLQKLAGGQPDSVRLPPHLVVRDSSNRSIAG
ncbi:LacI family DNA-binding transcriptional regulator [Achromobacter sp. UMC46]|uniref:LacI family DNA-binding transcriptional regulator n=1 Tax=Achromobacter sp. UMC46 TaxID=1862319 RepID=UPI0015FF5B1D|nr:LacI family DNA-binding transcriptional regulator [Achromobacter sp. UMC46]MBB1595877.1 LacI family transcriptional regulator [Achromobacter sp. UMC46]